MKPSRGGIILISALLVVLAMVVWLRLQTPSPPALDWPITISDSAIRPSTNLPPATEHMNLLPGTNGNEQTRRMERMAKVWNVKHAADLTGTERTELERKFTERFKPAIKKWCAAYAGHVPFDAESVTISNFTSRIGNHSDRYQYIFNVDGYTLTLLDKWPDFARVFYMSDAQGMKALNARPNLATAPDIATSVTRDDVLRMAQADTGVAYLPNQVTIAPTGPASGISGGAFVGVNKDMSPGGGGEIITGKSISLVFDGTGKLVNYTGPFDLETASQRR